MSVNSNEIRLRRIASADWTAIHEWASTEEACRFQPWGPNQVDDTKSFVADAVAAWHADPQSRYVWVAIDPLDGVVGLGELQVSSRRWRRGSIAYAVHTQHWGRGIGTVVAAQLIRFAFEKLGLHRVEGTCDPRNLASAAILRKVGMTREGQLREMIELRDGWRDSEIYSILDGESSPKPRR